MMYLVTVMKSSLGIEVMGLNRDLDLIWADGMVGVVPVFSDYQEALKYAGGKSDLIVKVEKQSNETPEIPGFEGTREQLGKLGVSYEK